MVDWKKELARDFLSLGSWVFYVLIIARILILPYRWTYLNELLIAGLIILIVDVFLRGKVDSYVSRALVLGFYTSLFYDNDMYGFFVKVALGGLILSSKYNGSSWRQIVFGVLLGLIGVLLVLVG